ncbi:hypothetical protein AN404_06795 [Pediococcus acidilactici]|nr:hypothetical protein AN404_06795 [Pediococcus acidilactici]
MTNKKEKDYTMQEMADILNVNKTTVYRFLKKQSIAPAMVKSNTNYYSATTMQHLKKHFNASDSKEQKSKTSNELLIETLQQQVASLQEELSEEKSRNDKALDAKDKQIYELNNRLRESHQLQLGLQEKLKMLPGSDKQLVDGETTDTSNTSATTKEEKGNVNKQKSPKKGLWQRLFG